MSYLMSMKTKTYTRRVKFKHGTIKSYKDFPKLKKAGMTCLYAKAQTDKRTGKVKLDKKGYGKVRYTFVSKKDFV